MAEDIVVPVILSGGIGSRLWPVSREDCPKYLMDLGYGKTMLGITLNRLKNSKCFKKPVVVCDHLQRDRIAEQLEHMGIVGFFIIVEPVGRNTAPALAVAAIKIIEFIGRCVCLVLPIDHYIEDVDGFTDLLSMGIRYVEDGNFLIYGVPPKFPETGYGYIKKGSPLFGESGHNSNQKIKVFHVEEFVEKPDFEQAKFYLNSNDYFWNSGIFMFRPDYMLSELDYFVPRTVEFCRMAVSGGIRKDNFFYLDRQLFSKCSDISIDCAIMERTSSCLMIPMDVGWNDLGSWKSLYQNSKKDSNGNVVEGDVVLHNVKNSYVYSENRLVTAVDLNNHAVVETNDAVLVTSIEQTQNVKELVNKLRKNCRQELFTRDKERFHWGKREKIFTSDILTIDYVVINSGHFISANDHFNPGGRVAVISGKALIKYINLRMVLSARESANFGDKHNYRIYNFNQNKLKLIKITGEFDFLIV